MPSLEFLSVLFSTTCFFGAVVALLVLHLVSNGFTSWKRMKEPPGPRPLPLLGNLLQLDLKRPHKSLCELSKEYGSVFTIYFGTKKVVVIVGYKAVKEALVSYADEFGDRDVPPILHDINQGHGILTGNGEAWREMRRFAISTLKDFGMGKRVAEDKILEECCHLIGEFKKHKGEPFDMTQPMNNAVSNMILSIMYGRRFEYGDPLFSNIVETNYENICMLGSAPIQLYNMLPWTGRWIEKRRLVLRNTAAAIGEIKSFIRQLRETLSPDICRGFIDRFLIRKQREEDSCAGDTHFNEKNFTYTVNNLISAGTDTTATTLRWALLLMAKYPQIQDRVQEEMSSVVGSRPVGQDDRKNLPYTNAVIHEVLRFTSIAPIVPHKTSRDVTFQGYFIKEGTAVFLVLNSVLYDGSEWEEPHTFNPAHFLDKEGHFFKRDAFMPFSAGRRACLGESLARMELFLFFTSLLQHFRFTPPPGVSGDDLDLTPVVGLILIPSPHELCAVSRQ